DNHNNASDLEAKKIRPIRRNVKGNAELNTYHPCNISVFDFRLSGTKAGKSTNALQEIESYVYYKNN
ncbi:hypothetical protein AKJ45_00715, partial [candidate division MSBL1 archaeon SCGC-AAA261F19]